MYSNGTEIKIVTQNVFGDGNHESTQLVLDALYQSNPNDKIVLDIGTGTGVQAIYATKWGAKDVLAVDIDYTAILTARNNFRRNNVEIKSRLNIYNEDLVGLFTICNVAESYQRIRKIGVYHRVYSISTSRSLPPNITTFCDIFFY